MVSKMVNPVEMWQSHQMTLKVGEDIDVDAFLNKLVNMGYRRESVVSHIGNSHYVAVSSIFIHL